MKRIVSVALGVIASGVVVAGAYGQFALPVYSTFDSDTVGTTPTMGVPHSPTGMLKHLGTEADPLVVSSALGIVTQPVQFVQDPDPDAFAMLVYDFDPNVTTFLRAEATVSLSVLADVGVMRSWMNSTGLIIGNIYFSDSGNIYAGGSTLGTYMPGVPVRLRMDVNIITGQWAAMVDDELNGFADDTLFTGLTFTSDPADVDNIGGVGVGYDRGGGALAQVSVAMDDILIMEIPEPGALGLIGLAALVLAHRKR